MKGQIKISEHEVQARSYYYDLKDLFDERINKMYLSKIVRPKVGWYAYKFKDGVHYFLWTNKPLKLKRKYLEKLVNNDWNVSIETTKPMKMKSKCWRLRLD